MGTDLNGREPKTSVEKDGGKSESAGSNQGGCPKWQGALGGREMEEYGKRWGLT